MEAGYKYINILDDTQQGALTRLNWLSAFQRSQHWEDQIPARQKRRFLAIYVMRALTEKIDSLQKTYIVDALAFALTQKALNPPGIGDQFIENCFGYIQEISKNETADIESAVVSM